MESETPVPDQASALQALKFIVLRSSFATSGATGIPEVTKGRGTGGWYRIHKEDNPMNNSALHDSLIIL